MSTTSSKDSNSNNVIPKPLNTHPECVIAPSPSPSYITHYPDWYFDIIGNNVHDKVLKKVLVAKDWITESLREEIMALSPKRSDITVDNLTQDFSVDPDQFKKCCMNFSHFIGPLLIINSCMLQQTYYLNNEKYV